MFLCNGIPEKQNLCLVILRNVYVIKRVGILINVFTCYIELYVSMVNDEEALVVDGINHSRCGFRKEDGSPKDICFLL